MTYQQAQQFISYAKTFGSRLGLDTIKELLERLHNPQDDRPVVHIAGTNGKGSVFAFLEYGLREGGYRVGRYISPSLFAYLESFQINGKYITEEAFAKYAHKVKKVCDEMVSDGYLHPTVFEVETAIAFLYFKEEKVDLVLLETGMGGLEDATNVVKRPLATVFASISMDHCSFLGDTIEKIAEQKAGIMRAQVPVIIANMDERARKVLFCQAQKHNSEVVSLSKVQASVQANETGFEYNGNHYEITMLGAFQADNAACAVAVWQCIKKEFPMHEEIFKRGLRKAKWPGRFEILQIKPYVIRDGAHNPDAVLRLKESILCYFPKKKVKFVVGIFKDKDYDTMLREIMPLAAAFYVVEPPQKERALPADALAKCIRTINNEIPIYVSTDVTQGMNAAIEKSEEDDVVVIFGSLSLSRFCKISK